MREELFSRMVLMWACAVVDLCKREVIDGVPPRKDSRSSRIHGAEKDFNRRTEARLN